MFFTAYKTEGRPRILSQACVNDTMIQTMNHPCSATLPGIHGSVQTTRDLQVTSGAPDCQGKTSPYHAARDNLNFLKRDVDRILRRFAFLLQMSMSVVHMFNTDDHLDDSSLAVNVNGSPAQAEPYLAELRRSVTFYFPHVAFIAAEVEKMKEDGNYDMDDSVSTLIFQLLGDIRTFLCNLDNTLGNSDVDYGSVSLHVPCPNMDESTYSPVALAILNRFHLLLDAAIVTMEIAVRTH